MVRSAAQETEGGVGVNTITALGYQLSGVRRRPVEGGINVVN
jgi:hypothetical protein